MGFSTSGAVILLLIAGLLAANMIIPTVKTGAEQVTEGLSTQNDALVDAKNTAIEVTSATYVNSDQSVVIEVQNTGTTTLSVSETDLLVDGVYVSPDTTNVADDDAREYWAPETTLTLTYSVTPSDPTPERVQVVTRHGIADSQPVS